VQSIERTRPCLALGGWGYTVRSLRRKSALEPDEWESWGALMMFNRLVLQGLGAELRCEHQMTVTEFDVLITLQ
jgi:hypothetical protein